MANKQLLSILVTSVLLVGCNSNNKYLHKPIPNYQASVIQNFDRDAYFEYRIREDYLDDPRRERRIREIGPFYETSYRTY